MAVIKLTIVIHKEELESWNIELTRRAIISAAAKPCRKDDTNIGKYGGSWLTEKFFSKAFYFKKEFSKLKKIHILEEKYHFCSCAAFPKKWQMFLKQGKCNALILKLAPNTVLESNSKIWKQDVEKI